VDETTLIEIAPAMIHDCTGKRGKRRAAMVDYLDV
jgi:hypothetical protein